MEFLLKGRSKVCGHLSNSVAGSITHPWVLKKEKEAKLKTTLQHSTCCVNRSCNISNQIFTDSGGKNKRHNFRIFIYYLLYFTE